MTGWRDGMVVLCAANGYDQPGTADWQLAAHLSRLVPVLYADPPASPLGHRKPAPGARLRLERPHLARLAGAAPPFPTRRGMTGITSVIIGRELRHAARQLGGNVTAVISAWPLFPVWRIFPGAVSAYWAQDDYAGGAQTLGLDAALVRARERRIAANADILITSSPGTEAQWQRRGYHPLLIPFGADTQACAAADAAPLPADVNLAAPVAGFIGRLNERTDITLLEAIAERGRSLLLVGPADPSWEPRRFRALCALPGVRHAGMRPLAAVPSYLRVIDTGIVPYRDSAFNRGSFPLKTLEYLAAGRPVVSTPLPSSRWLGTDLITIADGPGNFADATDKALDEPRTPELVQARQSFAARHSWSRRAAEMHAAVMDLAGRKRRQPAPRR